MDKNALDELLLKGELNRLAALFRDADKVQEAIDFGKTEVQKAAEKLRAEAKTLSEMKLELKPKKKKKVHYKTRRKRKRAEYRKYVVPMLKRRKAALLEGESWVMVETMWKERKIDYRISREEWMTHVDPVVVGKMFFLNRYDTKKPFSLENLIVRGRDGARSAQHLNPAVDVVLFDGAEHALRAGGYML